jgi:hypothetical protein
MGWREGIIVHMGDSFSLEFCCYLQDRENPFLLQPSDRSEILAIRSDESAKVQLVQGFATAAK